MKIYEDNIKEKSITFKLEGKAFDDGYDLYSIIKNLQDFQNILDKAYLAVVDKNRMSKNDRNFYKVKATEFRKGSFITDLTIYACGAFQVAMPILQTYSPSMIWDVTKEGFTYLKTILEAKQEGKQISIQQDEGGNNMILTINGSNSAPIYIGTKVYQFANRTFEDFKSLTSNIDGEEIEKISLIDVDKKEGIIEIGQKEKEIFAVEPKIIEEPINFKGEIFKIDTHAKNGKLLVTSCDEAELCNMEINFEILNEKDINKYCSVINKEAEFTALKKVVYDPLKLKDEIKSLKIITIEYI